MHRQGAAARGLVRVEVQAPRKDAGLIRQANPEVKTAFDVFGSDLPDEAFEGVFDQPRERGWREIDL